VAEYFVYGSTKKAASAVKQEGVMNTKIRVVLIGLFMALFCAGSAFAGFKSDSIESTYGVVTSSLTVSSGAANGYFMQSDANGRASWSNLFGGANVWTGTNSFDNILSLRAQVIASTDTSSVSSVKLMGGYSEITGARLMLTGDSYTGSEGAGGAALAMKDTSSIFQITERGTSTVPFKVTGNGNTEILGTLKIAGIADVKARFDAIATSTATGAHLDGTNTWTGENTFANAITRAVSIRSTDTTNTTQLELVGGDGWANGAQLVLSGDGAHVDSGNVEFKIKDSALFKITEKTGDWSTPFLVNANGNTEILGTLKIAGVDDVKAQFDAIATSTSTAAQLGANNTWTNTNTFTGAIVASTITVSGNISVTNPASSFYFGSETDANSWRITKGTGSSLIFEYTADGLTWVEKSRMIP